MQRAAKHRLVLLGVVAATVGFTLLLPRLGVELFAGAPGREGVLPLSDATVDDAGPVRYHLLLDTDRSRRTGCAETVLDADLGETRLDGFERVLSVSVEPGVGSARVAEVTLRRCEAGTFDAGTPVSPGGWSVGSGTGAGSTDVVEAAVALDLLGRPESMRVVTFAEDGVGGGDVLLAGAEGFTYEPGEATGAAGPRAARTLALLVLFGAAGLLAVSGRSRRVAVALGVVGVLLSTQVLAAAAPFESDGSVSDWRWIRPVATDALGDAAGGDGRLDLVAAYLDADDERLLVRLDVAGEPPEGEGEGGSLRGVPEVPLAAAVPPPFGSGTGTGSDPNDFSVTKTESVDPVVAGSGTGNLTYVVTASHLSSSGSLNGTGPTGIEIAESLTLPAGVVVESVTPSSGVYDGGTGLWSFDFQESLGEETLTVVLTVGPSAAPGTDVVGDMASLVASDLGDSIPDNNVAQELTSIVRQSSFSVAKDDGRATARPGETLVYTITITNQGPSDATGFEVSDVLPAGLGGGSWTCTPSSPSSSCTAGPVNGDIADTVSVAAGDTLTYQLTATVDPGFLGTLTNVVAVGEPGSSDPDTGSDVTEIVRPAEVSGTKTVSGSFRPGGTVVYTITLTNGSPGAQPDNPGDEMVDVLPPELALVSATVASGGGTAQADPGTNTVTWNGSIQGDGTVVIQVQAEIVGGSAFTPIENQAQIAYDGDGDGTNEAAAVTDDPAVGGAGDPTAFVLQPAVLEIPTAGTAGLWILALALVLAALAILSRSALSGG